MARLARALRKMWVEDILYCDEPVDMDDIADDPVPRPDPFWNAMEEQERAQAVIRDMFGILPAPLPLYRNVSTGRVVPLPDGLKYPELGAGVTLPGTRIAVSGFASDEDEFDKRCALSTQDRMWVKVKRNAQ